jgi:hypothetical protein
MASLAAAKGTTRLVIALWLASKQAFRGINRLILLVIRGFPATAEFVVEDLITTDGRALRSRRAW